MYYRLVAQCVQALKNVEIWLDKAEKHAKEKDFDVNLLMSSRLAPDMKPFIYQIQSASDYTKGAAGWLSGQALPKYEDTEQTIDDAHARIQKTIAFVESIAEAQYEGAADRKVTFSWAPGRVIAGEDYLVQMIIPNVYFHTSTAYAILRHNGVDIGKMDFLGPINLVSA